MAGFLGGGGVSGLGYFAFISSRHLLRLWSFGAKRPSVVIRRGPGVPGEFHGRSAKQKIAFQAWHAALTQPGTAVEAVTGEVHLRHHISPTGFYRGRKVLKTKADA
jgi:large subunit ribosomal protein L32